MLGQLIRARYRVVSRLATGETGTVYVAQQVSTGNRIALQVLHAGLSKNEAFVDGFRQVMTAVRALSKNHRSIVKVYDCDQTEDGRLYVAMELIEGRTLRDVILQDGPLAIDRALRMAEQMAEGLGVAHAFGIVHADVRPENIMLIGREEAVKILGFERARLKDIAPADLLDPPGGIPRAPDYVAPEQIKGEEITKQVDVYAFGVVLYEMLCGVVPFRASTPDAVLAMHLRQAPTPLTALRPEIPTVVEAKVLQALEKEPQRRQNHVNDVANEYLYESALFELAEVGGRSRRGRVRRITAALQAGAGQIRSILPKGARAAAGWKLAAAHRMQSDVAQVRSILLKAAAGWKLAAIISGVLILIAVALLWEAFSRPVPEVAQAPLPQPKPEEARVPGPASTEKPEGETVETVSRPPEVQTIPETPVPAPAPTEPEERKASPEIKRAPAPKKERVISRPGPPTPPPAGREAPGGKAESQDATAPDASAVIDWLLKRPSTGSR